MLEDRTVDVVWNEVSNKKYLSFLLIYTNTNDNHMMDLIQAIAIQNVSIDSFKTLDRGDHILYEVSCYVSSIGQIEKIELNLNKFPYVEKVEREMR